MGSRVLIAGVLCVGAVVLGLWAWAPPPDATPAAAVQAPRSEAGVTQPGEWIGDTEPERLPSTEAPSTAIDVTSKDCDAALSLLVETLLTDLGELPRADFHELAVTPIRDHLRDARDSGCPEEAWWDALDFAITGVALDAPVLGPLRFVQAVAGGDRALEVGLSSGEGWRGCLLGLCWIEVADEGSRGLELPLADFLERRVVSELPALPVVLGRRPSAGLRARLESELVRVAESQEQLLERELAVLALGTGVDADPTLLDAYVKLLFSHDPAARQILEPLLFVLMRATSPVAREALAEFASHPLAPFDPAVAQQALLRGWLARQPWATVNPGPHLDILLDARGDPIAQVGALSALTGMLHQLDADQARHLEQQLAVILEAEGQSRVVQSGTLAVLSLLPGGAVRLGALERVLLGPNRSSLRRDAATALANTPDPFRQQARSLLRRALAEERDAEFAAWLEGLLGPDG